jgi:hypothetical protein
MKHGGSDVIQMTKQYEDASPLFIIPHLRRKRIVFVTFVIYLQCSVRTLGIHFEDIPYITETVKGHLIKYCVHDTGYKITTKNFSPVIS